MIKLYDSKCIDFNNNGLVVLADCLSFFTTEKLNDLYEVEFEYPLDAGGKWQYIVEGNIVKNSDGQLFRIYRKVKTLDGIKANARHIFYDLLDNFLEDVRPIGQTGVGALDWILTHTQYPHSFISMGDVLGNNTKYFVKKDPVDAIMGADGIIANWGGELVRDNFTIKLMQARGLDRGVLVSYGKNIIGIEETASLDGVITRIYPTGKDGLTIAEKYVDSQYIGNYSNPKIKEVSFPDIEIEADLRTAAQGYFASSKCDIPLINFKVDFQELSKTEKYKNYSVLETVYEGDTVTVKHSRLNIDLKCKVISIKKNDLTGRTEKIELGSFKPNIATGINEAIRGVKQEIVQVTSDYQKAIDNATALITGSNGGNVVIRQDGGGKPYEILIMDTVDVMTAVNVWRWNLGGLGHSSTGINGPYDTAITSDGHIVASMISGMLGQFVQVRANQIIVGDSGEQIPDELVAGSEGWNSAEQNAKAYADALGQALQLQIDGSITTWFYGYVPSLANAPANTWTTTDDKNKHLGDLFYDTSTGYAYRFALIGTYQWTVITDTDVTKALSDAAKAQDTADGKRRIFDVVPFSPYDKGDLYAQGGGGDLLKCITPKLVGQAYVSGDWDLASKYTDDTAVKNLQIGGRNLFPYETHTLGYFPNDVGLGNAVLMEDSTGSFIRHTPDVGKCVSLYRLMGVVPESMVAGSPYSFSLSVRTTGDTNLAVYVRNGDNTAQLSPTSSFEQLPGVWHRVKIEGFLCDIATQNANEVFSYIISDLATLAVDVKDINIESGNRCSDWKQSPEQLAYVSATAQAQADRGVADAATANGKLTDIASDSKLTAVEKQAVQKERDIIYSENYPNEIQADSFGVPRVVYDTAWTNLMGYLAPLIADLTTTSDINGEVFRGYFKVYYDTRTALLNAIATKAKALADAAQWTVDHLEIGGTNLIPDSKIATTSSAYGFGARQVYLTAGRQYTYSVSGRIDAQAQADGHSMLCSLHNDTWVVFSNGFNISSLGNIVEKVTFVATYTGWYYMEFYLYDSTGGRTGTVTCNWCKMEIGNKNTDWTPAPEDNATKKELAAGQVDFLISQTNKISVNSTFYWDATGLYCVNGQNVVKLTSGGIGVGTAGVGGAFSTAITGAGIIAIRVETSGDNKIQMEAGALKFYTAGSSPYQQTYLDYMTKLYKQNFLVESGLIDSDFNGRKGNQCYGKIWTQIIDLSVPASTVLLQQQNFYVAIPDPTDPDFTAVASAYLNCMASEYTGQVVSLVWSYGTLIGVNIRLRSYGAVSAMTARVMLTIIGTH